MDERADEQKRSWKSAPRAKLLRTLLEKDHTIERLRLEHADEKRMLLSGKDKEIAHLRRAKEAQDEEIRGLQEKGENARAEERKGQESERLKLAKWVTGSLETLRVAHGEEIRGLREKEEGARGEMKRLRLANEKQGRVLQAIRETSRAVHEQGKKAREELAAHDKEMKRLGLENEEHKMVLQGVMETSRESGITQREVLSGKDKEIAHLRRAK
jgi:hypothetical protein